MRIFRIALLPLSLIHLAAAVFTALVGSFADGGDFFARLVLVVFHPLGAVGLVLLLVLPRPARRLTIAVGGLLFASLAVDLVATIQIATGYARGDWWLPLIFWPIALLGLIYACLRIRQAAGAEQAE